MPEKKDLSLRVNELARELAGPMTSFRRDLHRHPELGFQEKRTSRAIESLLTQSGINTVSLDTESGVLGVIEGRAALDSHPVTALRADMDALPLKEKTKLEYSSKYPDIMHACGHDGNTAMVLGAGILLSRLKESYGGTVKLIFQPGEETLRGAQCMIDQGVLANPRVDRIFACHGWPWIPTGQIGVYPGNYMACAGRFEIRITTSGNHGAYPHQAPDGILTACQIVQHLNCVVGREVNALDSAVLSVCTINGGQVFNVMPDEVILTGTIRCLNETVQTSLKAAIKRIVKGIAETDRCRYNLVFEDLVPPLCNSDSGVAAVQAAARQIMPLEDLTLLSQSCMGAEDFSLYLQTVSEGAFIRIGVTPEGQKPVPLHNGKFDFDDQALEKGMALLAQIVIDGHLP